MRGQFRGYRSEKGVAPESKTETFVALRLGINSWRWQGVPFYIRAGKCMPVTCTEMMIRLRRPPDIFRGAGGIQPNHFRFRISPDVTIAHGMMVKSPDGAIVRRAGGAGRARSRERERNGCLRARARRRHGGGCRPSSRARTMSKKRGASLIRCCRRYSGV